MFGYVVADKSELRLKEFEMYKAVYCSLCKTLGRQYGILARFSLSYDFTFLSLLQLALHDGCNPTERRHCVYNPFKKCNFLKDGDDVLSFPAAVAATLLYHKFLDNAADEKGFKRLFYKIISKFYKKYYKKAALLYPDVDGVAEAYIKEQSALEKEGCTDLDRAADPTAKMLGRIFEMLCEDQQRPLYRLGYCIGKWVYLTDVMADIEDDCRENKYNPLLSEGNTKKFAGERLSGILNFCETEAAAAFELLTIYKYKNILGNIIYLGLDLSRKQILKEKQK